MELVPIMSAPEMKIFFDSKIQLVAAETDAILNLKIQVPSSYPAKHLVMYFKIKSKGVFIGPDLVLYVNIVD